ncbi:MAG TPA: hypothetical protein VKP30_25275 [Polyangiaceae bacterium]|nr:hypothetical protein [Polyangiaceae bacterium]
MNDESPIATLNQPEAEREFCSPPSGPRVLTLALREQVRHAAVHFIQGLLDAPENRAHWKTRRDLDVVARQLWNEGLVVVYRLLFLLKLESSSDAAQRFRFTQSRTWLSRLSPSIALAKLVCADQRSSGSEPHLVAKRVQELFRLFCEGANLDGAPVVALGGRLFGKDGIPLIEAMHWSAPAVTELLRALLWNNGHRAPRGHSERIAYDRLEVEDLGRIYEWLLESEPGIARAPMCRLRRGKLEVVVPLAQGEIYRNQSKRDGVITRSGTQSRRTPAQTTKLSFVEEIPRHHFYLRAGLGRKTSGSYYTPHAFVAFLVRETLGPQVAKLSPLDAPNPLAILSLRVLDPAMGTGHFLVQACRFLGQALFDAISAQSRKTFHAECAPHRLPERTAPSANAKRAKPQRHSRENLATAESVEAANDLSSLLNALDDPLALAECRTLVAKYCLYGIDKNPLAVELARASIWLESRGTLPLTFTGNHLVDGDSVTGPTLKHLLTLPGSGEPLEYDGQTRHLGQRLQQRLMALHLEENTSFRNQLRLLAACWTGAVMRGGGERSDSEYARLATAVAADVDCRDLIDNSPQLEQLLAIGREGVVYELEFAEVFDSRRAGGSFGGFDAVLGNPPWDAIKFNTKEFLASFDLRVLEAPTKKERDQIETELTQSTEIASQFAVYQQGFERLKRTNDRLFSHQKLTIDGDLAGRQLDLYRVILERSCRVLRPTGYLGFVVPSSFHTAAGAAGVRRLITEQHRLLKYLSFVNSRKAFDISASAEFGLLVAAGVDTPKATALARFGIEDPELLTSPERLRLLEFPIESLCKGNPYLSFPTARDSVELSALVACRSGGRTFDQLANALSVDIRSTPTSVHMTHEAKHFVPLQHRTSAARQKSGRLLAPLRGAATPPRPSSFSLGFTPNPAPAPRSPSAAMESQQPSALLPASGTSSRQLDVLLHEGATFHRFTDSWEAAPRLGIKHSRLLTNPRWSVLVQHYKLVLRAIVGGSKDKSIAALLPPGCLVANSALVEGTPEDRPNANALALLGLLNSTVFSWLLSFYADLNVNLFALKYLPVPEQCLPSILTHHALRLTCNHAGYAPLWREQVGAQWCELTQAGSWPVLASDELRSAVRASIDAVVAHLYGLDRRQYAHVLGNAKCAYPSSAEQSLAAFDELSTVGLVEYARRNDPYWDVPVVTEPPHPAAVPDGTATH